MFPVHDEEGKVRAAPTFDGWVVVRQSERLQAGDMIVSPFFENYKTPRDGLPVLSYRIGRLWRDSHYPPQYRAYRRTGHAAVVAEPAARAVAAEPAAAPRPALPPVWYQIMDMRVKAKKGDVWCWDGCKHPLKPGSKETVSGYAGKLISEVLHGYDLGATFWRFGVPPPGYVEGKRPPLPGNLHYSEPLSLP